jgi:hypothetical protein
MENNVLIVEDINSKGYGIIPKIVMQDKRLTIEAKAIYAYFCSYAGAGSQAFPSVAKIMFDLTIKKDRFYKHLKILKESGYISSEQKKGKGKFTNSIYTLISKVNLQCPDNANTKISYTEISYTEDHTTKSNSIKNNNSNNNKTTTTQEVEEVEKIIDIYQEKSKPHTNVIDEGIDNLNLKKCSSDINYNTDVEKIQSDILSKIKAKISKPSIIKMLKEKGEDLIYYYLDNWSKFDGISMNSVAGYFTSAVLNEYDFPKEQEGTRNTPSNMANFEQREYTAEDFEEYYYKVTD